MIMNLHGFAPFFLFFIIGSDGFHALRFQSWISFQTKAPVFYIINKLLYINFSSDELMGPLYLYINATDNEQPILNRSVPYPLIFRWVIFNCKARKGLRLERRWAEWGRWRRVEDCGREIRPASQARWVD